jgi:hypothetical protein
MGLGSNFASFDEHGLVDGLDGRNGQRQPENCALLRVASSQMAQDFSGGTNIEQLRNNAILKKK